MGFGYELTNTTPAMYQSGSMVTYQAPQCISVASSTGQQRVTPVTANANDDFMVYPLANILTLPSPPSVDEATAYPTAKQWDSKHGAYVIPRLTSFDHDFNSYAGSASDPFSFPMATTRATGSVTPTSVDIRGGRVVGIPYTGATRITPISDASTSISSFLGTGALMPYTTTGIHLTGLSPESTFTLVATWYIQLCPQPYSGLSTMVQPSPAYDPRVYEIYTRVMR